MVVIKMIVCDVNINAGVYMVAILKWSYMWAVNMRTTCGGVEK